MNPFQGFFRYFRIFRRYIGRRLYVVFALSLATAVAEGVGISLLLPLLQAVQGEAEPDSGLGRVLHEAMSFLGVSGSVPWLLVVIGLVFFAKGGLEFLKGVYTGYLDSRL